MRIGIDVESGERSFTEYVKGSLTSLQFFPHNYIYLIGNKDKILSVFPRLSTKKNIEIIHASEVILMDEEPLRAINKKKTSSIVIGITMLKNKEIDVFFSPGNTGAIVGASVLKIGMIAGIKRPSMATFFPRIGGSETLILDIGANPDTSETSLINNAYLGYSYYKIIWDKKEPIVGLLNMGGESQKGTLVLKKAYSKLKKHHFFLGNVEGYNVFNGSVDVVVCNGFTGNSILKIAEATKKFFISVLKDVFKEHKVGSRLRSFFSYILSVFGIYTNKKKMLNKKILPKYYGAAPLLGINGIVLIGHGACSGKDLINAIELANRLYNNDYLNKMIISIKKLLKKD